MYTHQYAVNLKKLFITLAKVWSNAPWRLLAIISFISNYPHIEECTYLNQSSKTKT